MHAKMLAAVAIFSCQVAGLSLVLVRFSLSIVRLTVIRALVTTRKPYGEAVKEQGN
jgi:hypothetical protein